MLNLLLFITTRRKKTTIESQVAEIQKGNESLLNEVLESYKPFVKRSVSSVCKRYIYDTDDEFSIGLIAFHDAIMNYESKRGSLLGFADIVIRRKVIDYIRVNGKHKTIPLDAGNSLDEEEHSSLIEQSVSIEEYDKQIDTLNRQQEIQAFQEVLQQFKLSFQDLVKHSPKHEDARVNAIKVAKLVYQTDEYREYLYDKKKLPLKDIEQKVGLSRKTLERNRKFIIAIIIIMVEDFHYLKDYLKGRLEP